MEKIKDFIYEITDVLLATVIAIVIIFVIGWNLGDWFDFLSIDNIFGSPSVDNVSQNKSVSKINNQQDDFQDDVVKDSEVSNSTGETTEENISSQISIIEVKNIVIPNGTPAVGIANILLENTLIDSVSEFIELSESMNLSAKLKSGTFEISNDSSLEEIIRIITGQN
ncbi:MAG: hypothetical protein ACLKAK_05490 [Alkaliphilus sp.]